MKLTRLAFTCLSAAAGLAATAGLRAAGLTAAAAPGHPGTPALRAAVYDCTSQPRVRPAAFGIFCDGSRSLIKLSWSSWNLSEAAGTGVDYTGLCPGCVQGKWQHQDVVVVLWHPAPAAHHAGQYRYRTMTLLYPAAGTMQTITLPSS